MNKFSEELIESLMEACEHAEGMPRGVGVRAIEVPEVSSGDAKGLSHSRRGGHRPVAP